jgi:hypothetical protein
MKKPVFVLKNIKPDKIDAKYSLITPTRHEPHTLGESEKTDFRTKISELSVPENEEQHSFSFMDESKKDHQCVVTMKSLITKGDLPEKTPLHCFWCRHGFTFRPIGCPIDFTPKRITKKYHSEITKDVYVLRENVTASQLFQITSEQQKNGKYDMECEYNVQDRDYYLMDGMFCSFNCCLAFIRDNITCPLYIYSEHYLTKIYYDIFGEHSKPLLPAPSWRLLEEYGGHMTIEEYRKNFYKIDYLDIDNMVIPFPNTRHVGFLFEKQVKL